MRALAGEPGSAASSVSQNPLLLALQQQEAEANSPYYLKAMNAQTQGTYDNQLQAQEQALAARGLGSAALLGNDPRSDGAPVGQPVQPECSAANQMTTDKRQAALNNRMNMLNFLSGQDWPAIRGSRGTAWDATRSGLFNYRIRTLVCDPA